MDTRSGVLRARVVLVIATVLVIVFVVVVQLFIVVVVVVQEVGAIVCGWDLGADTVLVQRDWHFHAVPLSVSFGGQHLFPVAQRREARLDEETERRS